MQRVLHTVIQPRLLAYVNFRAVAAIGANLLHAIPHKLHFARTWGRELILDNLVEM
jgi:hypothetical protein